MKNNIFEKLIFSKFMVNLNFKVENKYILCTSNVKIKDKPTPNL